MKVIYACGFRVSSNVHVCATMMLHLFRNFKSLKIFAFNENGGVALERGAGRVYKGSDM